MRDLKSAAGAIVLAAGSSSRLGRPKQLLRVGGETLVRRSARFAIEAGCKPVIVVTGSGADSVAAELAGLEASAAFNANWSAGIGTSLRAGLAAMLAPDPRIASTLVLVCDQPNLDAAILRRLLDAWKSGGKPMIACEYAGTFGPPCCFDCSMFSALAKIADADGAKSVLKSDLKSVETIPWPQGSIDLDTPEDLLKIGI
jgi:molybdenum cofactor cytidylyltransferase